MLDQAGGRLPFGNELIPGEQGWPNMPLMKVMRQVVQCVGKENVQVQDTRVEHAERGHGRDPEDSDGRPSQGFQGGLGLSSRSYLGRIATPRKASHFLEN